MHPINYVALITVAVAAFILSSVWYIVFGKARMQLLGMKSNASGARKMQPTKMALELGRNLILAYVIAHIIVNISGAGMSLGIWLWIGFPVILLSGSVMWDNVPWKLAAIHAGDWLLKILLMTAVLSYWS